MTAPATTPVAAPPDRRPPLAPPPLTPGRPAPDVVVVCVIVFFILTGLHVVQPLLPMIARDLGVRPATAGALTSAVLFPLGGMPVLYGLLLRKCPLAPLMAGLCLLDAAALVPALLGAPFPLVLAGRLGQGLAVPGVFVCAMTWIGTHRAGSTLQRDMSVYAVAVIMGSFAGRFFAGWVETATGSWRAAFLAPCLLAALAAPLCLFLKKATADVPTTPPVRPADSAVASAPATTPAAAPAAPANSPAPANRASAVAPVPAPADEPARAPSGLAALAALFRQPHLPGLLFLTPLLCFASGAIMNALPFRLKELFPALTALDISRIYLGIIATSLIGLAAPAILKRVRHPMRVICAAVGVYLACFPCLLATRLAWLLAAFYGYNLGMAFVYASMPGIVNRACHGQKSVANGVWLALYYVANASGSYFPLLVYERLGFDVFVPCLAAIAAGALLIALRLRNLHLAG